MAPADPVLLLNQPLPIRHDDLDGRRRSHFGDFFLVSEGLRSFTLQSSTTWSENSLDLMYAAGVISRSNLGDLVDPLTRADH